MPSSEPAESAPQTRREARLRAETAGSVVSSPPRSRTRRVLGRITRILSWVVIVLALALILAFVIVPRIAGATPYTVLTGSMQPGMPPGTTVVVKPLDFSEIRVGDVITYQIRSGEPEVVTHRVIGVDVGPEGTRLRTQGDANAVADSEPVRSEQVRGKAWYWMPVIGYFSSGVGSDTRTWIARGLGIALLGYAAVTAVSALRPRRSRASTEPTVSDPTGD